MFSMFRPKKLVETMKKEAEATFREVKHLKPRRLLYRLVWLFIFAGIAAGIGGAAVIAIVSRDLPNPDKLTDRVVAQSTKIFDRSGKHLLYEIFADQKRTLVELEEIPSYAIYATIAIEDKKFFEHKCVRWISVARATVNNLLGRRRGSGGASP